MNGHFIKKKKKKNLVVTLVEVLGIQKPVLPASWVLHLAS